MAVSAWADDGHKTKSKQEIKSGLTLGTDEMGLAQGPAKGRGSGGSIFDYSKFVKAKSALIGEIQNT